LHFISFYHAWSRAAKGLVPVKQDGRGDDGIKKYIRSNGLNWKNVI